YDHRLDIAMDTKPGQGDPAQRAEHQEHNQRQRAHTRKPERLPDQSADRPARASWRWRNWQWRAFWLGGPLHSSRFRRRRAIGLEEQFGEQVVLDRGAISSAFAAAGQMEAQCSALRSRRTGRYALI